MKKILGIDSGSTTTKLVLMSNGQVDHSYTTLTGANSEKAVTQSLDYMKTHFDVSQNDFGFVVVTGYGRGSVAMADKQVTEITCIAKGISRLCPGTEAVIDIGGQDSKGIRIDAAGKVLDFVMNEKCAAGTGRFLDVMSRILGLDVSEMGAVSLQSVNPAKISSTCTVFAESEVISHIAKGTPVEDIVAGVLEAITNRIYGLTRRILTGSRRIAFTGGVAKNQGMVKMLERKLGLPLLLPENPQIVGAIGAALIGQEGYRESCHDHE